MSGEERQAALAQARAQPRALQGPARVAGALLAPMRAMAWKLPTVPDWEQAQFAAFLLRARGPELPRLPAGERGRPLLTGLLP